MIFSLQAEVPVENVLAQPVEDRELVRAVDEAVGQGGAAPREMAPCPAGRPSEEQA